MMTLLVHRFKMSANTTNELFSIIDREMAHLAKENGTPIVVESIKIDTNSITDRDKQTISIEWRPNILKTSSLVEVSK